MVDINLQFVEDWCVILSRNGGRTYYWRDRNRQCLEYRILNLWLPDLPDAGECNFLITSTTYSGWQTAAPRLKAQGCSLVLGHIGRHISMLEISYLIPRLIWEFGMQIREKGN